LRNYLNISLKDIEYIAFWRAKGSFCLFLCHNFSNTC